MPARLNTAEPGFGRAFAALAARRRESGEEVRGRVAGILAEIRARGDEALVELTARHDRFQATDAAALAVPASEIAAARAACPPRLLGALEEAAARIEAFHARQMPEPLDYRDAAGVRLGLRWTPIDEVGVYVPGGAASYPSSVLMNAIPARIAGARRIAAAAPAPDGVLSPAVLAAAAVAGVDEVWRIGGAQAVAAFAYGTRTIAPVDKIAGPGNAFVAEAKRQVFGEVGIDLIAGPSEILVVADAANDPGWIAADLLAQAEHDAHARPVLVTDAPGFADAVESEAEALLDRLPRAGTARASWAERGAIVVVGGLDEAPALIDRLAPEHLELACDGAEALAGRVRHAGAIFLGRHTPEAVGDYVAGPNHVLPTAGSARFASGLGVLDFMKRTTIMGCDEAALAAVGPTAVVLAEAEGLDAHAESIRARLGRPA